MYNELYLIEILHQTTTRPSLSWLLLRCILSKFYIKPQLVPNSTDTSYGCILSKFYIKPQPPTFEVTLTPSCILSKFYIKPQLPRQKACYRRVVSYRNSTSNHNFPHCIVCKYGLYLIEILHQTTTARSTQNRSLVLYLIEILHQTTTQDRAGDFPAALYLIEILHQTTTQPGQRGGALPLYLIEILHQTTTRPSPTFRKKKLYLIEILHQTTTTLAASGSSSSCILSKFYIKPQQRVRHKIGHSVVSYRNSTSNHNSDVQSLHCSTLYLIEILHQTTTSGLILIDKVLLTGCLPL